MLVKILIGVGLVLILLLLIKTPAIRFLKTVFLITRVTPYERTVSGSDTILILGDSTGYGTGASRSLDSIAGLISQTFPDYSIENNSRNGRTIGELAEVAKNLDQDYKLILLQIGGNDILQNRDLAVVENELREIVTTLESHTGHLVMMSSGNVGGAAAFTGEQAVEYERLTRDFRSMFLSVANETNLVYVDLFQEPADDLFIESPEVYLAIDGLHPSSAGYELWFSSLRPVLQNLLLP